MNTGGTKERYPHSLRHRNQPEKAAGKERNESRSCRIHIGIAARIVVNPIGLNKAGRLVFAGRHLARAPVQEMKLADRCSRGYRPPLLVLQPFYPVEKASAGTVMRTKSYSDGQLVHSSGPEGHDSSPCSGRASVYSWQLFTNNRPKVRSLILSRKRACRHSRALKRNGSSKPGRFLPIWTAYYHEDPFLLSIFALDDRTSSRR
jgi:hypothetical protein